MKVVHTWKKPQYKPPVSVPIEYAEQKMKITQNNAYSYAVQLFSDCSAMALADGFGFGKDRIAKFMEKLDFYITEFVNNVEWEFDSETVGMNFKEREQATPDLAYTLDKLDERLKPLYPPDKWKPYQERYGKFGGRVSWCKKG